MDELLRVYMLTFDLLDRLYITSLFLGFMPDVFVNI